jgi:hypothetical protein
MKHKPYTQSGRIQAAGVSAKRVHQVVVLREFACPELIKAAHTGLLAPAHCVILAKSLNQHDQRILLEKIPAMTSKERHDAVTALRLSLRSKRVKATKPKKSDIQKPQDISISFNVGGAE